MHVTLDIPLANINKKWKASWVFIGIANTIEDGYHEIRGGKILLAKHFIPEQWMETYAIRINKMDIKIINSGNVLHKTKESTSVIKENSG